VNVVLLHLLYSCILYLGLYRTTALEEIYLEENVVRGTFKTTRWWRCHVDHGTFLNATSATQNGQITPSLW